jgi:hypothetical protein
MTADLAGRIAELAERLLGEPNREQSTRKEFRDRRTRERFQELILAALRAEHRQLFDGEGGQ